MDTSIGVQFLGGVASDNLTGSSTLLTVRQQKKTYRFLIDAGLIQCGFKEFFVKNREILNHLDPKHLDGIILTHSHLDHVGRVPLITKNGFGRQCRIICTEATAGLLRVMLDDSANIQLIESAHLKNRLAKDAGAAIRQDSYRDRLTRGNYDRVRNSIKGKRRSIRYQDAEPLYTTDDVEAACALVKNGGSPYGEWVKLAKGIDLKFYASGHVLGGAITVIRIETRRGYVHLGFSGDLGRRDGIILPPPETVEEPLDYWFSESTYGGKVHPPRDEEIAVLLKLVRRAADRKQKIIIPSFALERTQEIVYLLSYYMSVHRIPKMRIYLDAPMASKITQVFAKNWESKMFRGQEKLEFNPFSSDNLNLITVSDKKSSLALTQEPGPYIVIAGSGMCDAGRVRDHLRANLGHKQAVVCLVGYMAENSLGRKLKEHLPIVKMNGEEIVVKAEVVSFDSFSAHADSPYLSEYAENIASTGNLKKIFLVHGDEKSAACLKRDLLDTLPEPGNWIKNIIVPKLGQEVALL